MTIVATANWTQESFSSGKLQASITFSGADVTGITASDFEVLTAGGGTTRGWVFDATPNEAEDGVPITIRATPPLQTTGFYKLRLNALSVRSDDAVADNAPAANVDSDSVEIVSQTGWDFVSANLDQVVVVEQANWNDEPTDLTHAPIRQPSIQSCDLRVQSEKVRIQTKRGKASQYNMITGKESVVGTMTINGSALTTSPFLLAMYTQSLLPEWHILDGEGQVYPSRVTVVNGGDLTLTRAQLIDNDLSGVLHPVKLRVVPQGTVVLLEGSAVIEIFGIDYLGRQVYEIIEYNNTDRFTTKESKNYYAVVSHVFCSQDGTFTGGRTRGWTNGTFEITAQDTATEVIYKPQDRQIVRSWTIEYAKGGRPYLYRGVIVNSVSFSIDRESIRLDTLDLLGKQGLPLQNLAGERPISNPVTGVIFPAKTDLSSLMIDEEEVYSNYQAFCEIDGEVQPFSTFTLTVDHQLQDSRSKSGALHNTEPPERRNLRIVSIDGTIVDHEDNNTWSNYQDNTELNNIRIILKDDILGGFPTEEIWTIAKGLITSSVDPSPSTDGRIDISIRIEAIDPDSGGPSDFQINTKVPSYVPPRGYSYSY